MILVLAGTTEAREIVSLLSSKKIKVITTTTTKYGGELAKKAGAEKVVVEKLTKEKLKKLIEKNKIKIVIDATHPFALEIKKNAIAACSELKVPYARFERGKIEVKSPLVKYAENFEEAGKIAAKLGNNIFYTAGVKDIASFLRHVKTKNLIARVLPEKESVEACLKAGIKKENIIAIHGKISEEINKAMLKEFNADILVTKDSGEMGFVKEKVLAALSLNLPVVVIKRPPVSYPKVFYDYASLISWVKDSLSF